MFYIFEMANNHNGSVEHAKKIIDSFASLAKEKNITAGIKFQFRQLDTFIHPDYKKSDLKFVKRFNSTRLEKEQFSEIINYARGTALKIVATPFDNESLEWIRDFDVDIVKVASCSCDDWPLLKEISKINKKTIISTGGVDIDHLDKVHSLFKKNQSAFAFMHCVGEYPTQHFHADLSRITRLQNRYPDIEIGFSTHESPLNKSLAPYAVAMGSAILEKHVGVETKEIKLNGYSLNKEQMSTVIDEVQHFLISSTGKSVEQDFTLKQLKRGVYLRKALKRGDTIAIEDLYFALPVVEGQADASMVDSCEGGYVRRRDNVVGKTLLQDMPLNSPLMLESTKNKYFDKKLIDLKFKVDKLLKEAQVSITKDDKVEVSCHYGLEEINTTGAIIIDKVNREFCKKIIVQLPGQRHPVHHHLRKEEAFELLHGDCVLVLNQKEINLKLGKPVVIPRKVDHSFHTKNGCVLEEISTTHFQGDSIYQDPKINKLKLSDRKIKISIKEELSI